MVLLCVHGEGSAAERIRVGVVSPAPGLSAPWIAKETGIFAKHELDADVILLTGSPRLVQSLVAGDVHYALVGAAAVMRARMRGAEVVILAAATNISSQKLLVNPKSGIRKLEDLKGRVIGVSQYGSEADGFARTVLSKAGLKPERDVAILQLGGHPQVAAALVAGKLDAGVLGGLALVTAQTSGAVVFTSAMRKHLNWYCRGFRGAAEMRAAMVRVNSARDVATCLTNYIAPARSKCELPSAAEPPPATIPTYGLEPSAS